MMKVLARGMLYAGVVSSLAVILVPFLMLHFRLELYSFDSGLVRLLGFVPIALGVAFVGSVV